MNNVIVEEVEIILSDFSHDLSVKDLSTLLNEDRYGDNAKYYFDELEKIVKLKDDAVKKVIESIKYCRLINIKSIIIDLGNSIVQPHFKLSFNEDKEMFNDNVSNINKMSDQAFCAILNVVGEDYAEELKGE